MKNNGPKNISINVGVKDNWLGMGNSKMGLTLGSQNSSRKEIMDLPSKGATNESNKNQQMEQLYQMFSSSQSYSLTPSKGSSNSLAHKGTFLKALKPQNVKPLGSSTLVRLIT